MCTPNPVFPFSPRMKSTSKVLITIPNFNHLTYRWLPPPLFCAVLLFQFQKCRSSLIYAYQAYPFLRMICIVFLDNRYAMPDVPFLILPCPSSFTFQLLFLRSSPLACLDSPCLFALRVPHFFLPFIWIETVLTAPSPEGTEFGGRGS